MTTKILFIDDDEGDRELAKQQMSKSGVSLEFLEAGSGEEGIQKAKELHPNIIAIDVQLSQMDGYETCKQIKAIEGLQAKVIVLTGKFDSVDALKARKMGADDFCVKTADYRPFWEAVKNLVNQSNPY